MEERIEQLRGTRKVEGAAFVGSFESRLWALETKRKGSAAALTEEALKYLSLHIYPIPLHIMLSTVHVGTRIGISPGPNA